MMANEKRLIDANAIPYEKQTECFGHGEFFEVQKVYKEQIDKMPTVDAVEVEKYKAFVEMYHELRENFIDYVCSGTQNVAPYCLNKCEECVDKWGYCKQYSDYCKGFNPAEVII